MMEDRMISVRWLYHVMVKGGKPQRRALFFPCPTSAIHRLALTSQIWRSGGEVNPPDTQIWEVKARRWSDGSPIRIERFHTVAMYDRRCDHLYNAP